MPRNRGRLLRELINLTKACAVLAIQNEKAQRQRDEATWAFNVQHEQLAKLRLDVGILAYSYRTAPIQWCHAPALTFEKRWPEILRGEVQNFQATYMVSHRLDYRDDLNMIEEFARGIARNIISKKLYHRTQFGEHIVMTCVVGYVQDDNEQKDRMIRERLQGGN